MTTLLTRPTDPGRPTDPAVGGEPPQDPPASGPRRHGFTDCRGEWHSLDQED